ncbi:unnamed protein product [Phytophthora lilii]|uniref:Unnamed protein product n=1 Tax=Phytophthora lilii TaxID=2077276 RepID=A0A9W6X3V4_9STRA|nr:unnamed protein product [Phytophthora lilii]
MGESYRELNGGGAEDSSTMAGVCESLMECASAMAASNIDLERAVSVSTIKQTYSYTDAEQAPYIEAVGVAMDQGFHQKFVQIHTEQLTGLEAHQSCVFIYWHRLLLLGYENMLRSLNISYQFITLPYWDHLSGSARQTSSNCSNIKECSPIIADFGGTTTGMSKSMSCQNGDENTFLSAAEKSSDPPFWTSCSRSGGGKFSSSDNITMRALANDGKTFVNVWQNPNNILYPFFKGLPYKYGDYVDAKDLRNYSYTYDISGGLANMYQHCNNSNTLDAVSLLADTPQRHK